MNRFIAVCVLVVLAAVIVAAQQKPVLSPPADTSVTIAAKTITIKYGAPSVRGRQMFGEGGVISKDKTYPVWRLGANAATALHTDGTLTIKNLVVPPGDYTLFALVNTTPWQLIVNKQTGQWGLVYSEAQDLGRVPMDMSKPPAPIETMKITLSSTGENSGKLQVEFENTIASVPFTVK
jgi:hypothetical protein